MAVTPAGICIPFGICMGTDMGIPRFGIGICKPGKGVVGMPGGGALAALALAFALDAALFAALFVAEAEDEATCPEGALRGTSWITSPQRSLSKQI